MTVPASRQWLRAPFVLYLIGLSSTALADAVLSVAIPFAVLATRGTAAALGLVVLCASLPRFTALFLGALADRLPLRPLMLSTALLRIVLVLGVGGYALWGGQTTAVFAGFALLNSVLVTLTLAASNVVVPRLVAEAHRPQGNSLVAGAGQGVPLVGYGLGGILVHGLGSGSTLLLAAPLYSMMAILAIVLPVFARNADVTRTWPLLRDLAEGWRMMRRQRLLLFNLVLTFALNLVLNILNVRSPLFTRAVGRGAVDYALLEGLFSGGALLGIVGVGLLSRTPRIRLHVGLGLVVFTLGMLGHSVPQLQVWFLASAVAGLGIGLLDVASMTQMQQLIPDGLRGRVTGISMSVSALGLSLGAVIGGLSWSTTMLMALLSGVLLLLSATYAFVSRPVALSVPERI